LYTFSNFKNIAEELDIISCEDNKIMKEKLNGVGRSAKDYLCLKEQNYEIKGNRHSKHRKFVQLEFRSCHWDHSKDGKIKDCDKYGDIYSRLSKENYIEVVLIDSYFDISNSDRPVSHFLTEKYYYSIDFKHRVDIDIFIKENELNLKRSVMFPSGGDNEKFYSISGDKHISRPIIGDSKNFSMYFNIKLDQEMTMYSLRVYSFADVIAQVGGAVSLFFPLLKYSMIVLVYKKYLMSVLNRCYQVFENPDSITDQPQDDRMRDPDNPKIRQPKPNMSKRRSKCKVGHLFLILNFGRDEVI